MIIEPAIRIEGLRKRYRIHHRYPSTGGGGGDINRLSEQMVEWAKAPFRRLGRMARQAGHHHVPRDLDTGRRTGEEDFWALDDVGFEVMPGEVVGIVGRNGAGKSTLLKILSRITEPTAGRIELNGRVASLLEVGTGFHPELTGRENIYLNGSVLGMTRAEIAAKFDEIVAFAEIERFLDTPVKRYSSGMYVRLAFAVAAHLEPEILIVDEVLAVGDSKFQSKCLGKMSDVARTGRTILFVSHNMAAVQSLCSRAVLLESGKMTRQGVVADVLADYLESGLPDSSSMDLARAPRESSTFCKVLQSMEILDGKGRSSTGIELGGEATVVVEGCTDRRLPNADLALRFSQLTGERLLTCRSSEQHSEVIELDGEYSLRCHLRDLRLLPGRYSVQVVLKNQGEVVDAVGGIPFEVTSSDIYGTGKLPRSRSGYFAADARWEIR